MICGSRQADFPPEQAGNVVHNADIQFLPVEYRALFNMQLHIGVYRATLPFGMQCLPGIKTVVLHSLGNGQIAQISSVMQVLRRHQAGHRLGTEQPAETPLFVGK